MFCKFRLLPETKIMKILVLYLTIFGFVSTVRNQRTKNPEKEKYADVELELKTHQTCATHLVSR